MSGLREKTIELIRKEGQFDMNHFYPETDCGTACCIAGNICLAAGFTVKELKSQRYNIGSTARYFWAKEYGQEEADRLGFTENEWGYNMSLVTPEQAIAHLNGADPVWTGGEYFEGDEDE